MTEPWRGTRRSGIEIMYCILDTLKNGQPLGKTRLMYAVNVSWDVLGDKVRILEGKGMIEVEAKETNRADYVRKRIRITQDGVRLYKELGMLRRLRDD